MERRNTALPNSQLRRPMANAGPNRGHTATRAAANAGIRLFRGDSGCRRMYIGHFQGTEAPVYKKSKLMSMREESMQTKIERIQNDPNLKNNKKRLDEEIRRLKFHENKKKQDFFFDFTETLGKERRYLGKPKEPDNSFTYAVIEVDDHKNIGHVYPASYMDFALESQMVASGENNTADAVQKAYLKEWKKNQRKQEEKNKSLSQVMSSLFGHSDDKDASKKKKKLAANEIREELADVVGNKKSSSSSPSLDSPKKKKEYDEEDTFNVMRKSGSKRLKRHKMRSELEELPDIDEVFSDDEDETNLRDMDVVDDSESDHFLSDDEWNGDSSEDDDHFNKLSKLQHEDVENKDYQVEESKDETEKKEKPAKSKYDSSSEESDAEDAWFDISDDDDDDDDPNKPKPSASSSAAHSASTSALLSSRRSRKRPLEKGNGASPTGKRRKLNNGKDTRANNESLSKEQVVAIFRRHGNHGISTNDLFSKLGAIYSIDQNSLKTQLVGILKQVATVKDKHWFLRKHIKQSP